MNDDANTESLHFNMPADIMPFYFTLLKLKIFN